MNLRIKGGRSCFYQWDSGQTVIVEHEGTIHEVHFAHKDDERSLTVITKEIENGVEANVPNILLQSAEDLFAYLVFRDEDGTETRKAVRITVLSRPKPESYVYTETEVLNYTYLDNRLKDLEGEGLANAVADYLKENPVEAGATKEEAAQIQQNKADIETLNREKLDASKLPAAVEDALSQAKASGEFKGDPGDDYVLTEADKQEIAELTAPLVDVPSGGGSGGSAEWELLNTIILEEDSNSVIIDKDSNGNSFDLSAFMFYIDRVASDLQTANGTIYVGNARSGYFGQMQGVPQNQTRIWMSGEFMTKHMWRGSSGVNAGGTFSSVISYAGGNPTSAPMIRLYGYYFGAGTKITLYGVRK